MPSPARNRPSVCLSCSHYSHLAGLSTLFFTIVHAAQTLHCCQWQPDLGFNSQHSLKAAFIPDARLWQRQAGLWRWSVSQDSPGNRAAQIHLECWVKKWGYFKNKTKPKNDEDPKNWFSLCGTVHSLSLFHSLYDLIFVPVWVKCAALQAALESLK